MPLYVQSGISGLGTTFGKSGALAYALSSVVSYTFPSQPVLWGASMVCTATDNGFAVGEEVMLGQDGHYDGVTLYGVSIFRSGNAVKVANRSYIWCSTPTGGGAAALTNGKWDIYIWAIY